MALKHYRVQMTTGTAVRLSSVLGSGFTTPGNPNRDVLTNHMIFSVHFENTAVIYIGNAGVSATDYLVRLEIPASSIPPAPFVLELAGRQWRPSDLYALGTTNDEMTFGFAE